MKGIVLAGGTGSRLYPITHGISKQLMPIYDKPMVYYPISTLMMAGIREILIITNPEYVENFRNLFGDGSQFGCRFEYKAQAEPRGLADAYLVGEEFIGNDKVAMILGDNIFYGSDLDNLFLDAKENNGATIFAYHVNDPQRYGVVEFDDNKKVISLEEKPQNPKSNYAQTGIYFTDNRIIDIAKNLEPSARGEIEVTDAMNKYLEINELHVGIFDKGTAWLDTGTHASMNDAAQFVQVIEERQGMKIGCIEEEAYRQGFITRDELIQLADPLMKSGYGEYLVKIANE